MRSFSRFRLAAGVSLTSLVLTGASFPSAHAEEADSVIRLDPVTVSARKRIETEQSVPIGMTVVKDAVKDTVSPAAAMADVAGNAPNFNFVNLGGQYSNFGNIRGVGSFSPLSADDTSVVFNIDEVPQSIYSVQPTLLDVDRVEILRGPQGTLFGRNAQGGAVNVTTNPPEFTSYGSVTAEVGSNGYRMGQLIGNAPLVPRKLAGRLAAQYVKRDGDIPNIAAGSHDGEVKIASLRGSLLATPTDRTTARLTLAFNRNDDTLPRFIARGGADFPTSSLNPANEFQRQNYSVNLKVAHDFDAVQFHSITSYQDGYVKQAMDLTDGLLFSRLYGLPAATFNRPGRDLYTATSFEKVYMQEFRLQSLPGRDIQWTAGVNLHRSEFEAVSTGYNMSLPILVTFAGHQENKLVSNSYSAFGETTVPIMGKLKGTLGLRLSHDDVDATYRYTANGAVGVAPRFNQDSNLSENHMAGRAALSYDWTPDVMTYASVARGFVPGSFPWSSVNNPLGKPEPSFAASTSMAYEAGFKSTLFGGRATLNGAVFLNDVKKGHLLVLDPAYLAYQTAVLDYRSVGGEVEAAVRLAPGLNLTGGLGYTHAELRNVPANSATRARNGNKVPNVPEVTANLTVEGRTSADILKAPGDLFAVASYRFVGSRPVDVANSFDLRAYGLVNGRVGWDIGSVSVYAFGYNLFDKRYETSGASYGVTAAAVRPGQGRTVGLGSTIRF